MAYINIPESTLAAGVTLIIAKLSAELKIKVTQQLKQLEDDVLSSCGNQRKLENLRRKLNGIKKFSINSKGRVAKLSKITTPLAKLATTLNVSIVVLQNLPIPNSTTTVGATNRFSNALTRAKELSKQINDTVLIINAAITGAAGFISILGQVETLINKIDNQIKSCLEQGTPNEKQETPIQPEEVLNYTGPDGTPYLLEVKLVDKTGIAPLRRAIAIDPRGITRYQSDDSYSSSTDVLLDEVKFRIDNNIRV